jgi:hypothetical protein
MKVALVVSITYVPLRGSGVSVPALAKRIPGFDFAFDVVVLAKRGNLPRIAEKVSAAIAKVVKRPQVVKQLHRVASSRLERCHSRQRWQCIRRGGAVRRHEAGVRPHTSIAEARRAAYTALRLKNLVF